MQKCIICIFLLLLTPVFANVADVLHAPENVKIDPVSNPKSYDAKGYQIPEGVKSIWDGSQPPSIGIGTSQIPLYATRQDEDTTQQGSEHTSVPTRTNTSDSDIKPEISQTPVNGSDDSLTLPFASTQTPPQSLEHANITEPTGQKPDERIPFPAQLDTQDNKTNINITDDGSLSDSDIKTYSATWDSLDTRPIPLWYDDSKFGIFMHWGVYSVPAVTTEWFWYRWAGKGNKTRTHIANEINAAQKFMKKNYAPDFSYTDFAPQFKAEFFNATLFARMIKRAGAKYFVFTSKHHEGYTMYPSKYSWNWNSVDVGPKRDIVGELRDAIGNVGDVRFGLYYSQYEWFNRLYLKDQKNSFKTNEYTKMVSGPQLHEIINKYKPDVLWSDGDWGAPAEYWNSTRFLAWLYNESPVKNTVVTNDRWGSETNCQHGDFYTCDDRFNPGVLQKHKWENCMTMDSTSWGFRRTMTFEDVLTLNELMKTLVKTVSCGGNLLLNVGPTSWGTIAPIFEERLTQLGDWLGVNGEAVYSTKPWIHQNDSISGHVWYTSQVRDASGLDPRRMYNPQTEVNTIVYAFLLNWPKDGVLRLGSPVPTQKTKVTMIGYGSNSKYSTGTPDERSVKAKFFEGGIKIFLNNLEWNKLPNLNAWVFKIEHLQDDNTNPTANIMQHGRKATVGGQ